MIKDRLKSLREAKKLNMKQMARNLGMPYTTYVNYESGTREPNAKTLNKIADHFLVPTGYILSNGVFKNWELILENWQSIAEYLDSVFKNAPKPAYLSHDVLMDLDLIQKINIIASLFVRIEKSRETKELLIELNLYSSPAIKTMGVNNVDTLNPDEKSHLAKYRSLDGQGKKLVDLIISNEYERVQCLNAHNPSAEQITATQEYEYDSNNKDWDAETDWVAAALQNQKMIDKAYNKKGRQDKFSL